MTNSSSASPQRVQHIEVRPLVSPASRVHDAAAMQQVLAYERSRADRSGQGFSLVTFATREQGLDDGVLQAICKYLVGRIRTIDEIGWLDDGRLAAMLPYTSAKGAWKVADDAIAALDDVDLPPLCEVHSYPLDWPGEDVNLGDEDSDGDEASSQRAARPICRLDVRYAQPMPWWKRLMDIFGAFVGLVLLSPVLLLAALVVKFGSRGPIFFSQERTGLGGRPFRMIKFRTMIPQAEAKRDALLSLNEQDGPAFKIKNDPRVTRAGQFLRKTSIDELPQLWNVLRGEMSLVGPRPLPCKEARACKSWQRWRQDVTPGLTCIWQVRGRSQVRFDEWMRMDREYIETRSFWTDLKLIVMTIPAVLMSRGAS